MQDCPFRIQRDDCGGEQSSLICERLAKAGAFITVIPSSMPLATGPCLLSIHSWPMAISGFAWSEALRFVSPSTEDLCENARRILGSTIGSVNPGLKRVAL